MAEDSKINVSFIQSVALACPDIDGKVRHFQVVIVQETESKEFRFYCDVVDPSKVKLKDVKEDELP